MHNKNNYHFVAGLLKVKFKGVPFTWVKLEEGPSLYSANYRLKIRLLIIEGAVASGYLAVHNNATGCDCFINPGFARTDRFVVRVQQDN